MKIPKVKRYSLDYDYTDVVMRCPYCPQGHWITVSGEISDGVAQYISNKLANKHLEHLTDCEGYTRESHANPY